MTVNIARRKFIAVLSGAAAAWPLAARSQQSNIPVIGFLDSTVAMGLANNRVLAFRQGLNEAGFAAGRNVAIEIPRFAEGQLDRLPALASDLVRRRVAVIVVNGATVEAAKTATSTIPIVFVAGSDPIKDNLVTSLNRPGGNVTGVSYNVFALNQKRLELLNEMVPTPAVIAALLDPNSPSFQAQLQDSEVAARALGRQILIVKAASEGEFNAAFTTIVQAGAGGLFVGTSATFANQRRRLVALAARYALRASYEGREFVEAGGLMSYGASTIDAYRRGGVYVGRILKGEKPGDMPVEMPTTYELVINLATAKAFAFDIPPKLLALADEVIE